LTGKSNETSELAMSDCVSTDTSGASEAKSKSTKYYLMC